MSPLGFGIRAAGLVWFVLTASLVGVVAFGALASGSLRGGRPLEAVYVASAWGLYVAAVLQLLFLPVVVLTFALGAAWVDLRWGDGATTLTVISLLVVATVAAATTPSLVDLVVVVGIAVVLPLALGGRPWCWAAAATSALFALALPPGWRAAVFALPVVVIVVAAVVATLRAAGPLYFWRSEECYRSLAAVYALVAASALLLSAAGGTVAGIGEPIVELTAVHYLYAGCAALVLAVHARPPEGRPWHRLGGAGLALTAAAPVVVATGFASGSAVAQVGGAVLMTLGVWTTATLQLRAAPGVRPVAAAALLGVSGLAVLVPMVLAVAWAAGQHWDVPALSIPDMARTHGVINALAFVLCGLVARRMERTR